uniref:Tyrosine-protein phosphatase domain-containing protein n=1 Tax=Parascaris univalens TaxID=6257 RepID=A0A915CJU2_PARUN
MRMQSQDAILEKIQSVVKFLYENERYSGSSSESYAGEEHDFSCECNECVEEKLEANLQVQRLINCCIERTLRKGIRGLRKERNEVVPPASGCRNRYGNVYCLDETRVKLEAESDANDYIHANYISTPFENRRFICSCKSAQASREGRLCGELKITLGPGGDCLFWCNWDVRRILREVHGAVGQLARYYGMKQHPEVGKEVNQMQWDLYLRTMGTHEPSSDSGALLGGYRPIWRCEYVALFMNRLK